MAKLQRLLSDWMLVKLEPEKKTTSGGIVIPDTREEPVRTGHVVMAGPGRRYRDKFIPMPDILGKRIAFMIAASQTKQGRELRVHLSEDEELVRLGDVLLVLAEGVEISR